MKSLVGLLEYLLLECGRRSGCPVRRDVKTLRSRVENEGDSFITITLPSFARSFERALELGRTVPGLFPSFGKDRAGIPRFLGGFLHRVFDRNGQLSANPSIDCIRYVRQICRFVSKVERPCSEARLAASIKAFVECDEQISQPVGHVWDTFCAVGAVLTASLPQDKEFILDSLRPRHGPGATEEHYTSNQKWKFRRWHKRLEDAGFTHARFGRGYSDELGASVDEPPPEFVEPGAEAPVRVVFVPKTLKAPRVIAVEPSCMQYAQQGLSEMLKKCLERHPLTAGHLNFRDQSVNQALALSSSASRDYATLDMSEASDRVSMAHVLGLLDKVPEFRDLCLACRSMSAKLPNGDKITLKKFASMGSALCFPLEALVFFTSIIAIRLVNAKKVVTARNVHSFGRDVYVYGDDLIIPADEAPAICDGLEALGFKVNRNKSFWSGYFRESCGLDCYSNEDVTPVYVRCDLPTDRSDASGIVTTVSTANQLYEAGYPETSMYLRKVIEDIIGPLPMMPQDSPAIAWWHNSKGVARERWNRDLQKVQTLCWIAVSPRVSDPLEGPAALTKCLWLLEIPAIHRMNFDPKHLSQSSARYRLALKRSWV